MARLKGSAALSNPLYHFSAYGAANPVVQWMIENSLYDQLPARERCPFVPRHEFSGNDHCVAAPREWRDVHGAKHRRRLEAEGVSIHDGRYLWTDPTHMTYQQQRDARARGEDPRCAELATGRHSWDGERCRLCGGVRQDDTLYLNDFGSPEDMALAFAMFPALERNLDARSGRRRPV